jgi:Zn-dependent peptidase ImmA (M78 family)
MTNRETSKPRARARNLLRTHGVSGPPVLVEDLAHSMGITVRLAPLEDELSGMIFMKEGRPIIVVNSIHPRNRQRFTIAHELGHYELHMSDIGSHIHVDKKYFVMARDGSSSRGFDPKEIEANRFAAELLVPREFLIAEIRGRIVDVEDEEVVAELARTFQVSPQMMAIRIGELAAARA